MQELISVIIPTYNRGYCVSRAIRSALCQSYARLEVIVVDDGSTDDTAAVIQREFGTEGRLVTIRQNNAGVSSARNHGMRIAQGDYIALLDSDDAWEPWKLEAQAACLAAHPELALVCSEIAAVDAQGAVIKPRYLSTMYAVYSLFPLEAIFPCREPWQKHCPAIASADPGASFYFGNVFARMIAGNLIHTSTTLFKKESLRGIGGFPEDMRAGEDYAAYLRLCRHHAIGLLDIPTTRYQIGMPDALTSPGYLLEIAQNYLRSVEPWLREDRQELAIPDEMIRRIWARALRWVGYEHMNCGDFRTARGFYLRSLRYRPYQPALWCYAAAGLFPNAVAQGIRNAYAFRQRFFRKCPAKQ